MSRNSHSIASIFVEKIGSFGQLKIIELGQAFLKEGLIKSLELSAEKTVAVFHEVSRNSHSIASIFVEKIGSFGQLKIFELGQALLKEGLIKSIRIKRRKNCRCFSRSESY